MVLEVAKGEGLAGFKPEGYTGELNYPRLNKKKQVVLTDEDRRKLKNEILPDIEQIAKLNKPPSTIEWKVCKSCSYNELCYG